MRLIVPLLGLVAFSLGHEEGYCDSYKDFFEQFCLSRTRTTDDNDSDPKNFCPKYSRICGVPLYNRPDRYEVPRLSFSHHLRIFRIADPEFHDA